jgi:hypothetical protein
MLEGTLDALLPHLFWLCSTERVLFILASSLHKLHCVLKLAMATSTSLFITITAFHLT